MYSSLSILRHSSWTEFQSPRKSHISVFIEKARMALCAITTMTCQCGHPCQGTPGSMVQDVDEQLQKRKDTFQARGQAGPQTPAFRRLRPTAAPAEKSKFVSGVEKLKGQVQLALSSFLCVPWVDPRRTCLSLLRLGLRGPLVPSWQ